MIVNFEAGFVFIHIPKTGGTSLRTSLQVFDADHDSTSNWIYRKFGVLGTLNQRARSPKTKHETYQQFLDQFAGRTGRSVSEARRLLPIAFIRHPVTRFISLHRYLKSKQARNYPDVPDDINEWVDVFRDGTATYLTTIRSLSTQVAFLKGIQGDHFIGRHETFEDDINRLSQRLELPFKVGHRNSSRATPASQSDWKELTASSLNFLGQKYASDLGKFGYHM